MDALRIEDRHPADADAVGARGEPHRGDRGDHGIFRRLRHGRAAEAVADVARLVREHGEVAGRLFETGQFQCGIARGAFAGVTVQRIGVACLEVVDHVAASCGILNDNEAPGLAQADRGRETGGLDQAIDGAGRQRIGAEAAHVAAPHEQLAQVLTEGVVELDHEISLPSGRMPPPAE